MKARLRWPPISLVLTTSLACSQGPTVPPAASRAGVDPAVELAGLVNRHRTELGCPALVWHAKLAAVARAHSRDMATRRFFAHVNPDGASPFDRMREAGIRWQGGAAENLALGQATARAVIDAWLLSEEHRSVLEDCTYTHHGVGVAEGRWTHLFVTNPAGSAW
ncbi:MAG: CAP domain-containing protein [Gemmatimonadota bacterium]